MLYCIFYFIFLLTPQAEFDSQREIFEIRARELGIGYTPPPQQSSVGSNGTIAGGATDEDKVLSQGPYRHTLRFEDLVYPPQVRGHAVMIFRKTLLFDNFLQCV